MRRSQFVINFNGNHLNIEWIYSLEFNSCIVFLSVNQLIFEWHSSISYLSAIIIARLSALFFNYNLFNSPIKSENIGNMLFVLYEDTESFLNELQFVW